MILEHRHVMTIVTTGLCFDLHIYAIHPYIVHLKFPKLIIYLYIKTHLHMYMVYT